jgi:hypothetical protein
MRAASKVLCSSEAIVIGPTPPGTGVMAEATFDTCNEITHKLLIPAVWAIYQRTGNIAELGAPLATSGIGYMKFPIGYGSPTLCNLTREKPSQMGAAAPPPPPA